MAVGRVSQKERPNNMTRFYQPDLSENIDNPFIRDAADKLVRRSYWLDIAPSLW